MMLILKNQIINSVVDNKLLSLLLLLIVFDIFTGICRAGARKKLNSSIGLKGLLKHTLIIITNIGIVIIAPIFEMEKTGISLLIFYIIQYSFSILENFIVLDIPIPLFLYEKLVEKNAEYKKYEKGD